MRYAVSGDIEIAKQLEFDTVIVGAGLAGLYTALNIDPKRSCCILTKERLDTSNSWLAQGGIAAAVAPDDAPDLHAEDTLIAGAGLCNPRAVSVLVEEGRVDIQALHKLNVPFDLDEMGGFLITKEGGHRRSRVVHAGGDATGRETVTALSAMLSQRENIVFKGRAFLVDVLLDKGGSVCGALIHADGAYRMIRTRHLVIATGGIGQVYQSSTNPAVSTGDGIAAAIRAGAVISGAEFVQFHPTGLYVNEKPGQVFLISEAVRGEGGILKNHAGMPFMAGKHELGDLAPRDIVARAIVQEMAREGESCVFLDTRQHSRDWLSARFPTIYKTCLDMGIDISRDLIPVRPVQHYLIGGISTDLHARTTVQGLYACGEAASTGVHGANRLAANSMLECLVFGRRAAEEINRNFGQPHREGMEFTPQIPLRPRVTFDEDALCKRVQTLMSTHCAVIRERVGLETAKQEISAIRETLESGFSDRRVYIELLNIATVANAIVDAALARIESVGAHYRKN